MELETKYKPIDLVIAHGCLLLPQIHFCFGFAALRLSFIDAHQLGLDLSGERYVVCFGWFIVKIIYRNALRTEKVSLE